MITGTLLLGVPTLSNMLFQGRPTTAAYDQAERYFARWWNAPHAVKALLHGSVRALFACWTECPGPLIQVII